MTSPALHTLRSAGAKSKNREGIPMVLALVDETGGTIPAVADGVVLADGAAVAAQVHAVRDELAPSMRDGDNGGVISAIVVASHDLVDGGSDHG